MAGLETIINEQDGSEMVLIPAGEYIMGEKGKVVFVDAFYIDRFPITNLQYKKFLEASEAKEPFYWNNERFNKPLQPVVGISWYDAVAYATWAGKRLPKEVEWGKAARGIDGREYPWGNMQPDNTRAIYDLDPNTGAPASIGGRKEGASPFGCFDMAGNVWEWCDDWYEEGKFRVVRGGSWVNHHYILRSAYRSCSYPEGRDNNVGFRCVKDVE
ncbi:MAG: formylglycine-generating enzyme family protein [Candidatus Brocadiaceae bacterium]|nr:formylglycine-generating enzyme family protein [Candidatus Brocadiaceae bacterium]